MPIRIPDNLPAYDILEQEHVFVMSDTRAFKQDIRPLKIIIFNLMPTKIVTETQLLRLLSNTPIQTEIDLMATSSYTPKNCSKTHMVNFYQTFDQIKDNRYDGMIITGAPVEHMKFEDVAYWDELAAVMEWSKSHVYSTLHICWGAQAGLYYHYGIPKHQLEEKMFGIFPHKHKWEKPVRLFRGFDDIFYVPHSRHTEVRREDILAFPNLRLLSESDDSGVFAATDMKGRKIFITGHPEYDPNTIKKEYFRDLSKGINVSIPKNYFPEDDSSKEPIVKWRSTAYLMFSNWLNYYVYQDTPFDLNTLSDE